MVDQRVLDSSSSSEREELPSLNPECFSRKRLFPRCYQHSNASTDALRKEQSVESEVFSASRVSEVRPAEDEVAISN